MSLNVKTVLQAQRTEIVFGQSTRQETANLVAILGDSLFYDLLVDMVVDVHAESSGNAPMLRPAAYSDKEYCVRVT
jgi:hypothetical protein